MTHDQHSDREWLQAQVAHCRRELAETRKAGNDPLGEMSWAGLVEKWQDKLDKLPAMPAAAPESPVGGVSYGPATHVWSGGRERPQRAPDEIRDAMRDGPQTHIVMDPATADALMLAARAYVGAVWDGVVALAADAGPLPLAGTEPWVEGDAEYRERLTAAGSQAAANADADMLVVMESISRVFRPRLVLAEV